MQTWLLPTVLCVLWACSTPTDRGLSEPVPVGVLDGNDSAVHDASVPDAATRAPRAIPVLQTFEDWANELGVHLDIFLLASMSCTRLLNCGWWTPPPECPADTTRAWCKNGGCDTGMFPAPYVYNDHPCTLDTIARPCDEIDRPISCEPLKSWNLSLRMTDGAPPGGWPVNPGHDGPPPPPWPTTKQ